MKGIVLAGGAGTRLYPLTQVVCKQLLPVYDKPMVYYPVATLMQAGIQDILIISTPYDLPIMKKLFGSGEKWGVRLTYEEQKEPKGIAEAFRIGEEFIGGERCALILGDNLFFGTGMTPALDKARERQTGVTMFAYWDSDPDHHGIIEFDDDGNVLSLEEKPGGPKKGWAATGLYFYDTRVVDFAKEVRPSARKAELEITDLNKLYLDDKSLSAERLDQGYRWFDAGTHVSLKRAADHVEKIQRESGAHVGCPEEVAFDQKWIDARQLMALAEPVLNTAYGQHLAKLARTGLEAA